MSGGFPQSIGLSNAGSYNTNLANQWGMNELTKSASANVKSAWFSMGTVTADCMAILLRLIYLNNSGLDTGVQFDVGIGPNGSQVVLIPNLNQGQPTGTPQTNLAMFEHIIPVAFPEGTQVWVRAAVNVASSTPHIGGSFTPVDNAFEANQEFAGVDTIGSTATGAGTALTGGNGTKGTYVQLTASTPRDYCGFFLMYDYAGQVGSLKTVIDIAIGGSGSQQIIAPNMIAAPQIGFSPVDMGFIPVQIPEGTQIWARAADLDGSTNKIGVTLYGVYL